jgi:ubiquinone/menaquinone biosynthesis C-methylase UbiE
MIEVCRAQRGWLFAQDGGIRKAHFIPHGLAFNDGFFDVVIACFVERFFPHLLYDVPFREMRRVLKPGGVLAYNLFKPADNWLECADETLVRLEFRPIEYRVQEFYVGTERRLIPLVIAHRGRTDSKTASTPGIRLISPFRSR